MLTPHMQELMSKNVKITERMLSQAISSKDPKSEKWLFKVYKEILPMITRRHRTFQAKRFEDIEATASLALIEAIKRVKSEGLKEGQSLTAFLITSVRGRILTFLTADQLIKSPSIKQYHGKATTRLTPLGNEVIKEAYAMQRAFEGGKLDQEGYFIPPTPKVVSIHPSLNSRNERRSGVDSLDVISWYDNFIQFGSFEGREDLYTFLGLSYFEICCLELIEQEGTLQKVADIVKKSHITIFKTIRKIKDKASWKYQIKG